MPTLYIDRICGIIHEAVMAVVEIGNVTISAYPDRINYGRPKRGTKWRA